MPTNLYTTAVNTVYRLLNRKCVGTHCIVGNQGNVIGYPSNSDRL